jgi:hypothetical protein
VPRTAAIRNSAEKVGSLFRGVGGTLFIVVESWKLPSIGIDSCGPLEVAPAYSAAAGKATKTVELEMLPRGLVLCAGLRIEEVDDE